MQEKYPTRSQKGRSRAVQGPESEDSEDPTVPRYAATDRPWCNGMALKSAHDLVLLLTYSLARNRRLHKGTACTQRTRTIIWRRVGGGLGLYRVDLTQSQGFRSQWPHAVGMD